MQGERRIFGWVMKRGREAQGRVNTTTRRSQWRIQEAVRCLEPRKPEQIPQAASSGSMCIFEASVRAGIMYASTSRPEPARRFPSEVLKPNLQNLPFLRFSGEQR